MAVVYRQQFAREYLLAANRWYFTRPAVFSIRMSDAWFCLRTYLDAGIPWTLLAAASAIDEIRSRRPLSSPEQALWLWIVQSIPL